MHLCKGTVLQGTDISKDNLTFVLSNTEYTGLLTLLENSSEWHGCTLHPLLPA